MLKGYFYHAFTDAVIIESLFYIYLKLGTLLKRIIITYYFKCLDSYKNSSIRIQSFRVGFSLINGYY